MQPLPFDRSGVARLVCLGLAVLSTPAVLITRFNGGAPTQGAAALLREGREAFRYDTFGDEALWTDSLRLQDAIMVSANGGVGPGVTPLTALSVGLKVDADVMTESECSAFLGGGVNLATYTGWGSLSHWNALVANLEMGGRGRFRDSRLDDFGRFPVAAANGFSRIDHADDQVTGKLAALQAYQLSLEVPKPPADSFDEGAARRGEQVFTGIGRCSECHVPPLYTDPGWNLHGADEIGIDDFQAMRSPTERYRTTPLGGLFTRARSGFYHDGRFADLREVVEHYDHHMNLGLGPTQKSNLIEFLRSL